MKVQCQICFEWIAEVSKSDLSYPTTGAMFKSIDSHHGYPDPFPHNLTWEDFKCPYGQHRPFIKDNEIMTDQGIITLEKDGSPIQAPGKEEKDEGQKEESGYTCETCEKVFQKEISLKQHVRMAHKVG